MSLTSYRAAPPRAKGDMWCVWYGSGLAARRRPTLPQLELQYHGRWGVSRPSSRWDRVFHPRDGHRATGPDPVVIAMGVGWGLTGWCVARFGAACGAHVATGVAVAV